MGENGRHHSYVVFDVFWGESIKITAWSLVKVGISCGIYGGSSHAVVGCCWLMTTQEKNRENPKELGEQVC